MNRPETTLFTLVSVDGKISTGDTDMLDFDHDLSKIDGVKEGLPQYYELEQQTDLFSLNTGRVMAKIGVNDKLDEPKKTPLTFVIIDNKPHLTQTGVSYLSKKLERLIVVSTNQNHPAKSSGEDNVVVFYEPDRINFARIFERLRSEFAADRLTIQSGGTLNAELLRAGLIDHLSIVVVPILIGGNATSTLIDGEANHTIEDLKNLAVLKLVEAIPLKDSYLHLRYDVIH